ncbi:MAG: M50 family metallopeptidase [Patescibacteria group bacterium]
MGILIFIFILSILVLVHEFGHFFAAKKSGVKVEEFGLGFPPRLFSFKWGETVYSINLLPFGGFVKVFGEEYHEEDKKNKKLYKKLRERAFIYKKPWQKAIIIIAGVIGNILLAWVLLSFLATQGIQIPTNQVKIEQVQENSPAQEVGLKAGEIIKKIKIEDQEIVVTSPEELIKISNENPGEVLLLTVTDSKSIERDVAITSRSKPPKNEGPLGISISASETKKYSILEAPLIGINLTISYLGAILIGFGQLFKSLLTFQKPAFDVAGPVGIAQFTGQALQFGYLALVEFAAVLSLNLAVLNIIPFPALDGGRLSFVIYEWITNKRINKNFERSTNAIGMLILLSLIVIITVNDIIRIFR